MKKYVLSTCMLCLLLSQFSVNISAQEPSGRIAGTGNIARAKIGVHMTSGIISTEQKLMTSSNPAIRVGFIFNRNSETP